MSDFWSGKKVVVTGGCGMIGVQLVRLLLDAGAIVTVLDDMSRGTNTVDGAQYIYADARNLDDCMAAFRGAFAVFNLAARVAGVLYNKTHHLQMYWDNMRLQTVPIEAAARAGIKHFLQTSSVCVYAPSHNHPCQEEFGQYEQPHPANAGYAWAKRMGERVAMWADLPHVVIVRPSNAYGPFDYFDERAHVIPALIRKALEDEIIHVNGTGNERREFIYSADVAAGMVTALERGRHGRAYNLGTHKETCVSIHELLSIIRDITHTRDKQIVYHPEFGGGDMERWSDCSRARKELGWEYQVGLYDGLKRTIDWWMERRDE